MKRHGGEVLKGAPAQALLSLCTPPSTSISSLAENGDYILTRTILEVGKLYDVSAVSFPANPNTDISARTKELCDGEIAKLEAERLHAKEINEKRTAVLDKINSILEVSND